MKRIILVFFLCIISVSDWCLAQNATKIEWDAPSRKFVTSGVYSRLKKLTSGELGLVYSDGPDVYIRKSLNNGTTWSAPVMVAHTNGYNNTNAELIQLKNGWLLYAWNGRPQVDGALPFTINTKISRDNGVTWVDQRTLYSADKTFENGCWEPAMLQIPSGEIQLFFANENPYRTNADQEITLMRSWDNGLTWSVPKAVCYRAGSRDGMPVPVYLNDNKGIVFAIEDNGLNGNFKPSIIHSSAADNWTKPAVSGNSPGRWGALRRDVALASNVYAGAPYLIQLPSGETILSIQSEEGRSTPTMKVYVGDYDARNFAGASIPFPNVPNGAKSLWNSLMVLDDNTIMATSSIDGISPGGIWIVTGKVKRAIQSPFSKVTNLPGKIEAEQFDNGGEAVAYHDLDPSVSDATYRTNEGVDAQICSEGGYNIGWTNAGEWTEYSVNVLTAGKYDLKVRVASPNAGKNFSIAINGINVSGSIAVPTTGDWQAWQTVTIPGVTLNAGNHVMRINMGTGGFNLNYVEVSSISGSSQWTAAQANNWYAQQPWMVGANFIPSTASNQLEMWQANTFDEATIDRELGYAEGIGMNTMRVFLHYLVWQQDWPAYKNRIEKYLQIADRHKIKTIFVLFDDCWNPHPQTGIQSAPLAGVHNSRWVQCPGDPEYKTTSLFPTFAQYTRDVLSVFKNDSRVIMWDLYNEAGNSSKGESSFDLLKVAFNAAWQVRPSQPITSGWWTSYNTMDDWILENSDVVTFHYYNSAENTIDFVNANLAKYNRPIVCTEYMARTIGSYFQTVTPWFYQNNIGAINWGLVDGKTQTKFPWGSPVNAPEPPLWFHEVFRKDGQPYEATETDMLRVYANLPKSTTVHEVVPIKQVWSYTFSKPSSNWMDKDFSASSWSSGVGGFGQTTTIKWNTPDIWMRRNFSLPDFSDKFLNALFLNISHDEETEVYINGVLAATLKAYSMDYIYFPIRREALLALMPGANNTIALHCHQTAGGQYIDAGLVSFTKMETLVNTSEAKVQDWKYSITTPASGWNTLVFDDTKWLSGGSGFGTDNTPNTKVNTQWASRDIWIRKKFNSPSEFPSDLLLRMYHDEDVEVYLNGALIQMEKGFIQNYKDYFVGTAAARTLNHTGENVLAIHCRQTGGGQYIDAGLYVPGTPAALRNNGTGLSGTYYNGMSLDRPVFTRVDPQVKFNWGLSSPRSGVNSDSFSVKWTGFIQPSISGQYTFYINSDNGRKLIINGRTVIDAWVSDWGKEYWGTIELTGGQRYPITLEYFDSAGGASIDFSWSSLSVPRQTVPAEFLHPDYPVDVVEDQNINPVVSISAPLRNSTYMAPATVVIAAIASDADGSISKVDFFNGSQFLGTDHTAPYSFTLNNISAGSYWISAKAFDNEGGNSNSSQVNIIVNQAPAADLLGADCGANGGSGIFILNETRRSSATSYSWWYTGSAQSFLSTSGQMHQAVLVYGNNFSSGQVCVGVNYSIAPWYQQYCKTIKVCGAAREGDKRDPESETGTEIVPNPSYGNFSLLVKKPCQIISVLNLTGIEVKRIEANGTERVIFGNDFPPGLYNVQIRYEDGSFEAKRIEKF